jgi:protein-S-isoprenylcysteine O-methyltransferase Ste14
MQAKRAILAQMNKTKAIFGSAIVLYFIIGLEILVMISPFAGFFYSIFNPFLLEIAKYPATRWLSAFFLPHMVLPPDALLKFIRIMGSVLFVSGIAVFLVCAVQVYASKFMKKGAVLKGLYSFIRHPQYVGLCIAGIGLAILWPRFLVIVLWLLMIVIYYLLSRDEERRMLKEDEITYRNYEETTGMFLPQRIERTIAPSTATGKVMTFVLIAACTIGGAFFLRSYTIHHLPLWTDTNVIALAVLPEDMPMMEHRMGDILNGEEVRKRLKDNEHYLVYFLPPNYIMQGMIADTGGEWKLYKRHHTMSMIADWIFHPFRHLREGHHHEPGSRPGHEIHAGMERRLVFIRISNVVVEKPFDVFSINASREPEFLVDMDIHNLKVLNSQDLPHNTGWGEVPTPVF